MSAAIQQFSSAGKEWNFSRQFFRFFFFNTSISSLTRRGNQQGRKGGIVATNIVRLIRFDDFFSFVSGIATASVVKKFPIPRSTREWGSSERSARWKICIWLGIMRGRTIWYWELYVISRQRINHCIGAMLECLGNSLENRKKFVREYLLILFS